MADVMVFVDDAVLGRLPDVCLIDGTPTNHRMIVREEIGSSTRSGVLVLLLFLGPVGWILAAIFAGRDRGEILRVELPCSEATFGRYAEARSMRKIAARVGLLTAVVLVALTSWLGLGVIGVWAVVLTLLATGAAMFIAERKMGKETVRFSLDASRRWVCLHDVHPNFAAAATAAQAASADRVRR